MNERKTLDRISELLVGKELAACVRVTSPITSRYLWKGKVVSDKEWLMLIKTRKSNYKKVEAEIKRLHDYKVPEILAVPVLAGNKEYLR